MTYSIFRLKRTTGAEVRGPPGDGGWSGCERCFVRVAQSCTVGSGEAGMRGFQNYVNYVLGYLIQIRFNLDNVHK